MDEAIADNKPSFWRKVARFFVVAYTGKWRFVTIGISVILGLYFLYFAFLYKPAMWPGGKEWMWKDGRSLTFHILMIVAALALILRFMYLLARKKLTVHKGAVLIALMGVVLVTVYGLGTPIFDCGTNWNQHDLYYGDVRSRYLMEDGTLDGGGGHFGMIMTIFRHNVLPEIVKKADGTYDFSFGAVLERYQPKTFYLVSAYFTKFNSLFIHAEEGIVSIDGSTAYGLTNTEWACFESLRILYTAIEIAQIYFIYRIFQRVRLKGNGLLIAFALTVMNPMWCYFANWANNDGMSTFFSIVALYYAICFLQERKTYQAVLCASGIGLAMSCKLGGALIAIVVAPMLIFVLVKSIMETVKGQRGGRLPNWAKVVLQLLLFAAIVFPLGLGWPIYSLIKYGQPIVFFSPVNNPSLRIVNTDFMFRFIYFPNADNFRMIWVYHSNANVAQGYIQDTSLLTAIMKTSLYGEYGFGKSAIQCGALYIASFALILFSMVAFTVRFIRFLMNKEKKVDYLRLFIFAGILIVYYGWAVYFVHSYPDTCNEDMRYIPHIILALSGIVGSTFTYAEEKENNVVIKKGTMVGCFAASTFFVVAAFTCYLSLCPWFYRA